MKHAYYTEKDFDTDVEGVETSTGYKMIVEGGLLHCKVCNGAEITLTKDCSGQKLTGEQSDAIRDGILDYVEGLGWINPKMQGQIKR